MRLTSVWTSVVQVFSFLTFSSPEDGVQDLSSQRPQIPIALEDVVHHPLSPPSSHHGHHPIPPSSNNVNIDGDEVVPLYTGGKERSYMINDHPVVGTPKSPQEGGPGGGLNCHYPDMQDWEPCYGPENRTCWLKHKHDADKRIDIMTDYENEWEIPKGKVRKFYLEVSEQPISPDGATMEHGKVFNRTYPGPWLEACWEVTVKNNLRWNGTSVHWHGFRQLESFHMDGVNGITECPIAPGDTFTYRFRAMQYGSAWYHSHYSLQYGDGLLGPITIYGPSTANFEENEAFKPLLLTDWNHRSVFEDWPLMLESGEAPSMTNILINGVGQFGSHTPDKYTLFLDEGKKHLLILINTAVDTTFVFSIDNHTLEVVEMDFVPIVPYNTTNLKIGIGQRYHVLVHGLHNPYEAERYGNYWMRINPARKCSKFPYGPDEQMGIIRYNTSYQTMDVPAPDPMSEPPLYEMTCADEPLEKLIPKIPWTVGNPVNIDPNVDPKTLAPNKRYIFNVGLTMSGGPNTSTPYIPDDQAYARWDMHIAPFRINFSDPTLLSLSSLDSLITQPHLDIVTLPNVDPNLDKWVWMVITAPDKVPQEGARIFFPAAHPIHLHGHDFAVLRQSSKNWYDDPDIGHIGEGKRWFTPDKLNCENEMLDCENPTRRDVVLLPASGYVVIAFKADNPGAWILHCHIAFHASSGLAMQIIENKDLIPAIMEKDKLLIEDRCKKWREWHGEPRNLWDWHEPKHFQDDSGV
ncbi:multicopper oxidase-domain-containing protein [Sordaria sp. MPI-SDFR-AT-0083]|nr:multicopper oxidase-domain-containing protein [Sordaria sp. MPI-SDFR-AT-0083]